MLEGAGFEVIDLGLTCRPKFIAAINEHKPGLVGLSALLTTTAPMMRVIVNAFQAAGVRDEVKVVGGAAVSRNSPTRSAPTAMHRMRAPPYARRRELLAVAA